MIMSSVAFVGDLPPPESPSSGRDSIFRVPSAFAHVRVRSSMHIVTSPIWLSRYSRNRVRKRAYKGIAITGAEADLSISTGVFTVLMAALGLAYLFSPSHPGNHR